MEKKASSFSGQIGFVLAAAGSAVGVGNLWRFPYLAAKDGGGLFLLVYLVLVLTFGFTLLTSDIAIGRRTKQSAIRAYETMRPKWKFLGILTFLVPVLIMTYYAVIGGWITKYAAVYLTGQSAAAAEDGYFTSFITSPVSPVVFALLFMGVTAFIVYNGVEGGIERVSRYMMPILLVLVVVIAGYALTLRHEDASGQMRTGLEGLRYYLTPHMEGLTVSRFLQILLDAMSQLFFSLSVSMGIMITYGSYVKPDVDLNKAVNQIEIFDTGVALLAGAMIIPAVYVFSGTEGMSTGPSLMFVSLPKVFNAMGKAGVFVGILFFVTAIFATLTSCISVLESITANCMEIFHSGRKKTVLVLTVIYLVARKVLTFKEAMACVPKGFIAMVPPIIILTLAVSLKAMINALGADVYVYDLMYAASAWLYSMLPAVIFVVACILAFASGTSWGTFGILIPIVTAVFPADSKLLIIGISACCAGAVCGDHCSPISDTTIMASAGAQCEHLDHVSTQLPYALTVAIVSFIGFIVAGFAQNVYIPWLASAALLLGVLLFLRARERKQAE